MLHIVRIKISYILLLFLLSIFKINAQNLTEKQFIEDLEFLKTELPKRHKNLFGKISEINTQQIKAAIRATRFPWNTANKTSEISKILRDADLMYPYVKDPNIVKQLTTGLFNEMFPDVVYEEATEATKELFKDMKCKFHTTFVWNTRWAKMKAFKYNYPMLSRN
jgi:hypothetical protein